MKKPVLSRFLWGFGGALIALGAAHGCSLNGQGELPGAVNGQADQGTTNVTGDPNSNDDGVALPPTDDMQPPPVVSDPVSPGAGGAGAGNDMGAGGAAANGGAGGAMAEPTPGADAGSVDAGAEGCDGGGCDAGAP